jgi:hypothetical protein
VVGLSGKVLYIKKWVLIIFITISGSLVYLTETSDGFRYQQGVYEKYLEMTPESFWIHFSDVISFKNVQPLHPDLYYHIIAYIVGSIFNFPKLFFVIISFVFSYFYVGTLFKVIKLVPTFRYNWMFYAFLTCLVLWKGIEGINTVRTWTGLWVLAYGLISYFETKRIKYLFFIFCVPFIHFSYYVMAIPAWLVLFLGSRPKFYSMIFFLSFFISIINPEKATESLSETELGEQKTRSYSVEEEQNAEVRINEFKEKGTNWYVTYGRSGIHIWAVKILALIVILRGYYNSKMTLVESNLFSVGLLTIFLSSSAWFIYALAARSSLVGGLFILIAFIMMAQRGAFNANGLQMNIFEKYAFVVVLILFIPVVILRVAEILNFTSFFVVSLPILVWINSDWNLPLIDAIKFLTKF